MVGEDFPVILDWPGTQDNNVMHAKPDLRVFLKWMITRSGSVITAVMSLKPRQTVHQNPENRQLVSSTISFGGNFTLLPVFSALRLK